MPRIWINASPIKKPPSAREQRMALLKASAVVVAVRVEGVRPTPQPPPAPPEVLPTVGRTQNPTPPSPVAPKQPPRAIHSRLADLPEIQRLADQFPAFAGILPLALDTRERLAELATVAELDDVQMYRLVRHWTRTPTYLRAVARPGAMRYTLEGDPTEPVTDTQQAHARKLLDARKGLVAGQPLLPPDSTAVPKENLVPARIELTVKFNELPTPVVVQSGMKIALQTNNATVTTILPAKAWRKLEQATQAYPQWVAALSGSIGAMTPGAVELLNPAVQVFEKKPKSDSGAPAVVAAKP